MAQKAKYHLAELASQGSASLSPGCSTSYPAPGKAAGDPEEDQDGTVAPGFNLSHPAIMAIWGISHQRKDLSFFLWLSFCYSQIHLKSNGLKRKWCPFEKMDSDLRHA